MPDNSTLTRYTCLVPGQQGVPSFALGATVLITLASFLHCILYVLWLGAQEQGPQLLIAMLAALLFCEGRSLGIIRLTVAHMEFPALSQAVSAMV